VDIWGPRRQRFEAFPTAEQFGLLEAFADAEAMGALMRGEDPNKGPKAPRPQAPALPAPGEAPTSSPLPASLRDARLGSQGD
jgi:hypothetical protein